MICWPAALPPALARQEQERSALEARVQFEQFFTRELAQQLARDPTLLKGADRPVALLFCDVRGFSSFSESLEPERTMDWIGDVMGALSECVLREEGVLVDYIGDEMLAMWVRLRSRPIKPCGPPAPVWPCSPPCRS